MGAHTVVVRAPGYRERRRTLQLSKGLQRVDLDLDHEMNWHLPAAGAAAGGVVIGTVVAIAIVAGGPRFC